MESSKSNNGDQKLFCHIRKRWVKGTKEEEIRQNLLGMMIGKLGYPRSLLAVEKALHQMPHLSLCKDLLPKRRADLLCFTSAPSLLPLLLIECKQEQISLSAIEQVLGYNAFLKAPFVALSDERGVFLLLEGKLHPGLPYYEDLLKVLKSVP